MSAGAFATSVVLLFSVLQPPLASAAQTLAQVQADRGFKAIVVRSESGLDEMTTSGITNVWDATTTEVRAINFDPTPFNLTPATLEDLRGGDANANAQIVRDVLDGRDDGRFAAIRDVVALNAAAALVAFNATQTGHRYGRNVPLET